MNLLKEMRLATDSGMDYPEHGPPHPPQKAGDGEFLGGDSPPRKLPAQPGAAGSG